MGSTFSPLRSCSTYQASEIGRAAANLLAQARHRPPDNLVNLREVREAARGEKGGKSAPN
jgi:hypothetical protein